jgi:hypothetical protein
MSTMYISIYAGGELQVSPIHEILNNSYSIDLVYVSASYREHMLTMLKFCVMRPFKSIQAAIRTYSFRGLMFLIVLCMSVLPLNSRLTILVPFQGLIR